MPLSDIRKKIDAIDAKLIALLNERADLVHEVGVVKKKGGHAIYAPEREERCCVRSSRTKSKGRLPETAIRAIYREIMSASLALEKQT
jgi:chorismate mutase/prephenate dehydratase